MLIPIHEVKIDRARFRGATGDIDELAQSIAIFGQLQPILIDDTYELIAGFRRLTALKLNGASHVEAYIREQIDEISAREMELEENIQREDMTWQEKQRGLAELHKLKSEKDPTWNQAKTAVIAGTTRQADIADAVKLTNAMTLFPELANAKNKSQALSWLTTKVKQISRVVEVKSDSTSYGDIESRILLGDSTDVIKTVPSESFHAIVTDPPFGVDYNSRIAGTVGELTEYQDDRDLYKRILGMAPEMYRVLKPNGWLVFFFGMSWYREVVDSFESAGFNVDPIPLIWDRSGGRTFTNRPDRWFTKGYDVALHALKGDAKLAVQSKPNIIKVDPVTTSERETLVERPIELYEEIIRRLTIPGEIVADFFVGSGSCPSAAARLGRHYFGIEKDAERRAYAIKKIAANTPDK